MGRRLGFAGLGAGGGAGDQDRSAYTASAARPGRCSPACSREVVGLDISLHGEALQ
jgi:hypothetical protein